MDIRGARESRPDEASSSLGELGGSPGRGAVTRGGRPPRTAADAMITIPKTLGVDISLAEARQALADPHVHMLLLTRDGTLHGTLVREDLPVDLDPRRPAVTLATLAGRTIGPERSLVAARRLMDRSMSRRLAVTDPAGTLLGLLCLNRTRQRFCTEADVLARAGDDRPTGGC